jgi:hypothetical protein
MNLSHSLARASQVLTRAGLIIFLAAGCKPAAPQPAAKPPGAALKPVAIAAASAAVTDAYVSVFEDLLPPKGRDPFFPDSHRREPAPPPAVVVAARKAAVASDLLLKGIVVSATHRLAVVNNQSLEVGEEAPVRAANGIVRVKCLEIGDDYAVVQVEGEARPQRLEMEKK